MNVERITAIAQAVLTLILVLGFFAGIYLAWFADVEISPERLRIVDTMNGVAGSLAMMAAGFWLQRQRNTDKGA